MLIRLQHLEKIFSIGCLILPAIFSCYPVCAQNKLPDVTLSIDISDRPLAEVLEIISAKSGIPFSYNPKKIQAEQKINYKAVNQTLTTVLNDLSQQCGLSYSLVENQVILEPEQKTGKPAAQVVTLSGYAKDGSSGEALIGANVLIKELQTGVACNAFGFYS